MDWTQSAPSANDGSSEARVDDSNALARLNAGAAPAEVARVGLEPQRYKVQFEASEEYVELVERAKALLSHKSPRPDLGDLHLRAMRALVTELEREKYAMTTRQRVARRPAPGIADEHVRRGVWCHDIGNGFSARTWVTLLAGGPP